MRVAGLRRLASGAGLMDVWQVESEHLEWSVVTATGLRDVCRDEEHARAELARWPEYVRIEWRPVIEGAWLPVPA